MKSAWIVLTLALGSTASVGAQTDASPPRAAEPEDEHLWLEDVMGEKALAWVKERNAETEKELAAWPDFGKLEADLLAVLDSEARIPYVGRECGRLYNFWQDASHPRGVWRRTTFDEYRKPEPKWDVLLDLDALAKAGETWFWQEARLLFPGCHRALVALSRAGGDANVIRELRGTT